MATIEITPRASGPPDRGRPQVTDQQAKDRHAQFPHMTLETIAYYAGRNEDGCEFEAPELIAAYKRGRRHVRSEDRLSADTSWD